MHQLKLIIGFKKLGRSVKETTRLTGLSRNTVRTYFRRIQSSGLSPKQLLVMDDESLRLILQVDGFDKEQSGRKVDTRFETIEKKLKHYTEELQRSGVTKQLLWEEYRVDNPEGYGYSQFCEHLRDHSRKDQAVVVSLEVLDLTEVK